MTAPIHISGSIGEFLAMTRVQRHAAINVWLDQLQLNGGNINAMDPLNTIRNSDQAEIEEEARERGISVSEYIEKGI